MPLNVLERVGGVLPPLPTPKLQRSNSRLLGLATFYVFYLLIGAAIFSAIESPREAKMLKDILKTKRHFLKDHKCTSEESLEEFIEDVIMAHNRGISPSKNITTEPNWSFGQSLFFAGTIVTTIGYGHVTPLSEGGKVFCIIFALIGIPATAVLMTAIVERLRIPTTMFLQFLNSKLGHLYQPFNIRVFHLSLIGLLVFTLFFAIPAGILSYLEPGWKYLDALYYCFISLTTIGLGDYIPGDAPNQHYRTLYKICTTGYLLIGLIAMMLMLALFSDIPQLNFGVIFLLRSEEVEKDPEKVHIASSYMGSTYTGPQQSEDSLRHNIHVKARPADTPSPEDLTPVHARP